MILLQKSIMNLEFIFQENFQRKFRFWRQHISGFLACIFLLIRRHVLSWSLLEFRIIFFQFSFVNSPRYIAWTTTTWIDWNEAIMISALSSSLDHFSLFEIFGASSLIAISEFKWFSVGAILSSVIHFWNINGGALFLFSRFQWFKMIVQSDLICVG